MKPLPKIILQVAFYCLFVRAAKHNLDTNTEITVRRFFHPMEVYFSFIHNPYFSLPKEPTTISEGKEYMYVDVPPPVSSFVWELTGSYKAKWTGTHGFLLGGAPKAKIYLGWKDRSSEEFEGSITDEAIDLGESPVFFDLEKGECYPLKIVAVASYGRVPVYVSKDGFYQDINDEIKHAFWYDRSDIFNPLEESGDMPEEEKFDDSSHERLRDYLGSGFHYKVYLFPETGDSQSIFQDNKYRDLHMVQGGTLDKDFPGISLEQFSSSRALEIYGHLRPEKDGIYTLTMAKDIVAGLQIGPSSDSNQHFYSVDGRWTVFDTRLAGSGLADGSELPQTSWTVHLRRGRVYPFRLVVLAGENRDWFVRAQDPFGREVDLFSLDHSSPPVPIDANNNEEISKGDENIGSVDRNSGDREGNDQQDNHQQDNHQQDNHQQDKIRGDMEVSPDEEDIEVSPDEEDESDETSLLENEWIDFTDSPIDSGSFDSSENDDAVRIGYHAAEVTTDSSQSKDTVVEVKGPGLEVKDLGFEEKNPALVVEDGEFEKTILNLRPDQNSTVPNDHQLLASLDSLSALIDRVSILIDEVVVRPQEVETSIGREKNGFGENQTGFEVAKATTAILPTDSVLTGAISDFSQTATESVQTSIGVSGIVSEPISEVSESFSEDTKSGSGVSQASFGVFPTDSRTIQTSAEVSETLYELSQTSSERFQPNFEVAKNLPEALLSSTEFSESSSDSSKTLPEDSQISTKSPQLTGNKIEVSTDTDTTSLETVSSLAGHPVASTEITGGETTETPGLLSTNLEATVTPRENAEISNSSSALSSFQHVFLNSSKLNSSVESSKPQIFTMNQDSSAITTSAEIDSQFSVDSMDPGSPTKLSEVGTENNEPLSELASLVTPAEETNRLDLESALHDLRDIDNLGRQYSIVDAPVSMISYDVGHGENDIWHSKNQKRKSEAATDVDCLGVTKTLGEFPKITAAGPVYAMKYSLPVFPTRRILSSNSVSLENFEYGEKQRTKDYSIPTTEPATLSMEIDNPESGSEFEDREGFESHMEGSNKDGEATTSQIIRPGIKSKSFGADVEGLQTNDQVFKSELSHKSWPTPVFSNLSSSYDEATEYQFPPGKVQDQGTNKFLVGTSKNFLNYLKEKTGYQILQGDKQSMCTAEILPRPREDTNDFPAVKPSDSPVSPPVESPAESIAESTVELLVESPKYSSRSQYAADVSASVNILAVSTSLAFAGSPKVGDQKGRQVLVTCVSWVVSTFV